MPTITVTPDPDRTYVLVETDWSDQPTAEHVSVVRVDPETGTETSLRPYVCFEDECILTSCGHALFWDTEVPLDKSVFYRTRACPEIVASTDPCTGDTFVTAESGDVVVPSEGVFRFKDPVRPCHDVTVPLCAEVETVGGVCDKEGITFQEMDIEQFAANSLLATPTNRSKPIAIARARRGVSSTLRLVTHTFADRDALLTLLAPGSPLLWQGPPEYGIPDRYMDVGTVSVARGLPDHRFQARVESLPHTAVNRQAGSTQGVCGSRVQDLCDVFGGWGAMSAAGLTWQDLLRGLAGT